MFNIRSSQLTTLLIVIGALLIAWYFPWILRMTFSLVGKLFIAGLIGTAAYALLGGRR